MHQVFCHDGGRIRLKVDCLGQVNQVHCGANIRYFVFDLSWVFGIPIEQLVISFQVWEFLPLNLEQCTDLRTEIRRIWRSGSGSLVQHIGYGFVVILQILFGIPPSATISL